MVDTVAAMRLKGQIIPIIFIDHVFVHNFEVDTTTSIAPNNEKGEERANVYSLGE